MAIAPTLAEIHAQTKAACNTLEKEYLRASQDSPNLVDLEDTLSQALEGNYTPRALEACRRNRAKISDYLSPSQIREVLDPCWLEYAYYYGYPATVVDAALCRFLYTTFAETGTPITFQRRNPTFGAITAGGSNTGTGTINKLTTSAHGYTIENIFVGTKTMTCIQDRSSGAQRHRETFRFRDAAKFPDFLNRAGSGADTGENSGYDCFDGSVTTEFVGNPSFHLPVIASSPETPASTTAITNWTISGSTSNIERLSSDYYRDYVGETTPTCVRFKDNETLTQLLSVRNARFEYDVPYYCQIAYKRESSCDGTLTLTLGGQSSNVALSAGSSWTILRIALGTKCWLRNFNAATMSVSIALSSRTTGTLLVDDFILRPMIRFGGSWYAPVGGATPFLRNDVFTFADTIGTDAVLKKWVTWGEYPEEILPPASSPVVSDPS